ncbi:hypothetical protein NLM33_34815 [Bradyrhizobium sp. CCGUVB1N3]|uniref:hypothetical protein n=1 Tax=Bradyrhizobium sp. CCGUVB1N3 TaxID=2949629 RepID=UPI0020B3E3CD|nr:hypothetical protein [Bradyrhizobium sp. CCGUVB1N3]MCP3475477.1 hypothetical protein [Bradyrhizobium sp. CCGUVB1N3]
MEDALRIVRPSTAANSELCVEVNRRKFAEPSDDDEHRRQAGDTEKEANGLIDAGRKHKVHGALRRDW